MSADTVVGQYADLGKYMVDVLIERIKVRLERPHDVSRVLHGNEAAMQHVQAD
jgi:hypothetical protein